MSFKCTGCGQTQENGVKPQKRVLETREKKYFKYFKKFDRRKREYVEKKVHVGTGFETVREGQFCKPCDPQEVAA